MNAPAPRCLAAARGSALLAALCFAVVLAIALGSYITVCYRTLEMSSRSMQATQSLELAELGLEDVLWALNNDDWSTWTITGTTATKSLTGFAYANNVSGQVDLRITSYDGSAGARTVTVTGTTQSPAGATVRRTLTGTSAKAPLFVNAVAGTTGRVKFKSAGTVDSYTSSLGEYEAQTPTYSAIVASGSTSVSSATVQLTNAQIKGFVSTLSTGPSYGTSAKVVGPTTPATTKIDPNQLSTSPYQPVFDELTPSGTSTLLPTGTATVGTAGGGTEVYHTTDLTLNGNQTLTIAGPVVITVTGSLNISNSAKIQIATTGSLEIHLAGDLTINGNGIQNDTKLPRNLAIIGTAAENDTLGMATNTAFHGVIYTPLASITVSNSQAIYGSIVAKAVTFNASPSIHYDLSLRQAVFSGIETPYAISDWRETSDGG
jgi:hypothetical protein